MNYLVFILGLCLAVSCYRLGLADGLSTARRGRLALTKEPAKDTLLKRIDAYDGRKEPYGTGK